VKCSSSANNCRNCKAKTINVFCDLPDEALQLINESKIVSHYERGQFVFNAGSFSSGVYCINDGTIKVEAESSSGQGHMLQVLQAGDFVGYKSLFANEPYWASGIAHEASTVCFIPKDSILDLVKKYPEVALKLLTNLSKEVRSTESRFCNQVDKGASQRIAEAVLFLREKFEDQKWTRKDIAEWAGTTPETVMRTLAEFHEKGIIEQIGRQIKILDRKRLLSEANLSF
jgi:CRP-like cAMP-binding protein